MTGGNQKGGDNLSALQRTAEGQCNFLRSIVVLVAWMANVSNAETQSLRERPSLLAASPKLTCERSDWHCTDKCLDELLEDEENAIHRLYERWSFCTRVVNTCPECRLMGLSDKLNITWLRFGDLAIDPPPANCANNMSSCSKVHRLNISLCIPSDDPPAVSSMGTPNITYMATGGFAGQDCTSTEYLLGLPYDESAVEELKELCAILDNVNNVATRVAVEGSRERQESSAFIPRPYWATTALLVIGSFRIFR